MKVWIVVGLSIILAVADRVVKLWALSFPLDRGFFIRQDAGDWWGIELFRNTHAVFGFPKIDPWFDILLVGVGVFLLVILSKARSQKDALMVFGILLIMMAGMSNVFDRLWYGFVIDMVRVGSSVWNIADAMILVGFVITAIRLFQPPKSV